MMMFGGYDRHFSVSEGRLAVALDLAAHAISRHWRDAVFQTVDRKVYLGLGDVPLSGATDLFVFRDAAACCSWRDCGRTTENGTGMIHLMVDPGGLTVVVDNPTEPVADSALKEIDGLLGRLDILSPSPTQAPTISAPKEEEKKTMKNFRAREVVQAEKWEGLSSIEDGSALPTPPRDCIWKQNEENKLWYLYLETPDSVERVNHSDWVVASSIGEHRVHSDLTFRALYQAIDPPTPRTAKFEVSLTVADLAHATAVEADEVEVEDNGQLVFLKEEPDEDGDSDEVEVARFNGPCWAFYKRVGPADASSTSSSTSTTTAERCVALEDGLKKILAEADRGQTAPGLLAHMKRISAIAADLLHPLVTVTSR